MAGYIYSDLVNAIGAAFEVVVTSATSATPFEDPQYNLWLPRAIEAAEQRIYRELDLLMTRATDITGTLTANSRSFQLPGSTGWIIGQTLLGSSTGLGSGGSGQIFIVLEELLVQVGGLWQPPLMVVSKDYLEQVWPNDTAPTTPSIPTMFCQVDQLTVEVAPPPDQAYPMKCFGTQRPVPLSSINTVTMLSQYLPDLMLNATLVSMAGFQRDFGAASDDPQKAMSWEAAYRTAKDSAATEEFRKKYASEGAWNRLPSPLSRIR